VADARIDADDPRLVDPSAAAHAVADGGLAADYVAPPRMTLVPAATQFSRLEHDHGPLALLLTASFRNESAWHIWLYSLAIRDAGTWYQPMLILGDQYDLPLPRTQSLIAAPYIRASAVAERFALFHLPERGDHWPTHLQVTAKATFVRRRARRLVITLTPPA
jgi:hypothetical protein